MNPLIELWMSIIGISMSLSGISQVWKIYKTKSSDNVSLILWIIIVHGLMWWLYYGILIGSISLIITNSLGIIIDLLVINMVIKYKRRHIFDYLKKRNNKKMDNI